MPHRKVKSHTPGVEHLIDRQPLVSPERLIAQLVPPPTFSQASFTTYQPDPVHPSQQQAVQSCIHFCHQAHQLRQQKPKLWRRKITTPGIGIYLDGGFGVGKTHLLASIYREFGNLNHRPRAFASFMELTQLAGVFGFSECIELLANHIVICIDEFELDDPGNITLVSRLLSELVARGVCVAATSNTLPEQLGEGRFAVQDFLREINTLSKIFTTIRIDGPDYRHRDLPQAVQPPTDQQLQRWAAQEHVRVSLDNFDHLCDHLASMHPSRYATLVEGIQRVFLTGLHPLTDQNVALRIVAFVDRLYDAGIPVVASGAKVDTLFSPEMLAGGYRKKYLRATSRLLALTADVPQWYH